MLVFKNRDLMKRIKQMAPQMKIMMIPEDQIQTCVNVLSAMCDGPLFRDGADCDRAVEEFQRVLNRIQVWKHFIPKDIEIDPDGFSWFRPNPSISWDRKEYERDRFARFLNGEDHE